MTADQACALIDYLEELENRVNHQSVMDQLESEINLTEEELDKACRALSAIAGRDYSIL
jgi:hypothetical protein